MKDFQKEEEKRFDEELFPNLHKRFICKDGFPAKFEDSFGLSERDIKSFLKEHDKRLIEYYFSELPDETADCLRYTIMAVENEKKKLIEMIKGEIENHRKKVLDPMRHKLSCDDEGYNNALDDLLTKLEEYAN